MNKPIKLNEKTEGDFGYIGFDHKGQQYEIYAPNADKAMTLLREKAKPSKAKKYLCSVHCCERPDGSVILQSTCF